MKLDSSRPNAPLQLGNVNPVDLKRWFQRALIYTLMVVLAIPLVFPVWWMVSSSFKPRFEILKFPPTLLPSVWRFENYVELFDRVPFHIQYWNSVYIAILVTVGVLAVSSLAGYAFARIQFPAKNVLFILLLSSLLMSEEVTILPLFVMMKRIDWVGTHLPLIIIPIFGPQAVFGMFLMRQFFLSLPVDLEESARLDGLGRFGMFRYIAAPLAKPAFASLGILTFLSSWNAFLEPLIYLGGRAELFTLPLAIVQYTTFGGEIEWAQQLAAATLSAIPMVIVFFFLQKHFIQGFATAGLK